MVLHAFFSLFILAQYLKKKIKLKNFRKKKGKMRKFKVWSKVGMVSGPAGPHTEPIRISGEHVLRRGSYSATWSSSTPFQLTPHVYLFYPIYLFII